MDPTRSGGRLPIPGASASNTVQNSLSGPSGPSWHSARDPSNSNGPSDQSQSQSYPGAFPPGTFDSFLQPITSQSGLISNNNPNNSGPGGPDPSRIMKKRSRDEEDIDPNVEAAAGKYGTSPQRLAELTAGFPTPPTNNNPPQLITTGRMTKTHADPLIAQLINPDGTPKRPMNAFMIFARKRRPEVAADNPNLRTGEISKLLSAEWKAIDNESKQFYLTKAKELKENFTSIFPTYVYKRRPNNSRKRRKTEDATTYGGPGAMSAIDRGEGGLSEDEEGLSPAPGSMSPGMPHPLSGIPGISAMGGHGGVRRPGDPTGLHMPPHHHHQTHGMVPPPPPHDLPGPYNLHGSQYGSHHRGQNSPTMYYDPVSGGQSSSRGGGGALWPSLDAKREPKSPRMENNNQGSSGIRLPGVSTGGGQSASGHGQNAAGSMRNGSSTTGSGYGFSIPSPNFGPGPGLPPIGRPSQGSQGGSNPASASQTPLLNSGTGGGGGGGSGGGGGGSMLPPPPSSLYSNHGHGSSHSLNSGHGNHGHGHSNSYFSDSWNPSRPGQSPSSSSLNLNGPSSNQSSGSGGQGPDRQNSSRNRSDSLGGGPQSASSNWNI